MDPATTLPNLLMLALVAPLLSFTIIWILGRRLGKEGVSGAYIATGAILFSCLLSFASLAIWLSAHGPSGSGASSGEHHAAQERAANATVVTNAVVEHVPASSTTLEPRLSSHHLTSFAAQPHGAADAHGSAADHDGASHDTASHDSASHDSASHDTASHDTGHTSAGAVYTGDWYTLGEFGSLRISIGYYIDALTIVMFCMVTLIASCIHFYAYGYMHEELHDVTDHEITLNDGSHLHRRGRFHRFFQYLSLFCFSMLGIVVSGNIAMTFVFWELVGICSYFLIGFYIERKTASNAANKAFIVNRVGDFGMIIGLMALWSGLGTFNFGDTVDADGQVHLGIFSQVRPAEHGHKLITPDGMVLASASGEVSEQVTLLAEQGLSKAEIDTQLAKHIPQWRGEQGEEDHPHYGYGLLVVAGLGIFCGCVGKSAQFPLHVWLPDAMEGPTPVSALVHSATMVAAGVFLVGRFYPVFTPEVLLVIAYTGGITLFMAATIAITATDIKRVLAYSTVSQLGYMMLALGVGGWLAGLFHLITHAFFKSLLFMCSGSVIHACHTNEMPRMGGLLKKMPWTGYTMLVGCLAIIGAGIPFLIGFSGYYSKDAIIEQSLSFTNINPAHRILFFAAAGGAAMTAFYMFRLWYMTFAGKPRDEHVYEHAHESPKVMYMPLVVLSVFAVCVAWPFDKIGLPSVSSMLEQARPAGTLATVDGGMWMTDLVYPNEHDSHLSEIMTPATWIAFSTAMLGLLMATAFYLWRFADPGDVSRRAYPIYNLFRNKWWFDELYDFVFIRPTHWFSSLVAGADKQVLDRLIDGSASTVRTISSRVDDTIDGPIIDGSVNWFGRSVRSFGVSLRAFQTGQLRLYVMQIIAFTAILFCLISMWHFMSPAQTSRPPESVQSLDANASGVVDFLEATELPEVTRFSESAEDSEVAVDNTTLESAFRVARSRVSSLPVSAVREFENR